MYNWLLFIFWVSAILIAHTYLIYPLFMVVLFSKPKKISLEYNETEAGLPSVAVLIAAYNEERVIKEKIASVLNSDYKKLKVYVGSDASDDNTNSILEELKLQHGNLDVVIFKTRSGKINIINHLQSLSDEEVLVMTDANVIFKPTTVFELVRKFKEEKVGIVAANIVKVSSNNEGISYQEKVYLSMENRVKAAESNAFNLVMGAEGGCYAIRNNLFSKVPSKFIVDDFFITLQVLIRGKMVLFNEKAICSEDVDSAISGEYRRKVRISSGNFQNLFFFKKILLQLWKPIGFTFWSHKVLRWLTPFFLLFAFVSSALLANYHQVFFALFVVQLLLLLLPLVNSFVTIKSSVLKFIVHFYLMNFALFEGFLKFSKGIKSSIWQPVKRNV